MPGERLYQKLNIILEKENETVSVIFNDRANSQLQASTEDMSLSENNNPPFLFFNNSKNCDCS